MKTLVKPSTFAAFSLMLIVPYLGCDLKADNCEETSTCKPEISAGTTSTVTSATGGKSSGGSSGTHKGGTGGVVSASGATGGKGGTSTTAPCNGACTGTKPICDTDKNECVECTKKEDCTADATKSVCNTTKGACVACNENNDCKDAAASRCDTSTNTCSACSIDDDCKQIDGKAICLTGDATLPNQCVQCTGKRYSTCGQLEGVDLVCDSLAHTCTTDKKVKTGQLCQPCVSDAQCRAGQYCYEQTYKGAHTGYFCFWKQGDTANGAPLGCSLEGNRPYIKTAIDVTTVDGETISLCTLSSVTTCAAVSQYKATDCAPTGTADNANCGFSPGLDSRCSLFDNALGKYRCTNACVTDDDCKGSGTGSSIKCLQDGSLSFCTF